jgi:hypothetical protein
MINKIKTVELIEKSMLQQISKDIFLVNKYHLIHIQMKKVF